MGGQTLVTTESEEVTTPLKDQNKQLPYALYSYVYVCKASM